MKIRNNYDDLRVVLSVPPGIEVACINTARRETSIQFEKLMSGLIISKKKERIENTSYLLRNPPIWTFGAFNLVCSSNILQPIFSDIMDNLIEYAKAKGIQGESYWLDSDNRQPHQVQKLKRSILKGEFGLVNNPTSYSQTLKLLSDETKILVLLGPSISVKSRFSYRKSDVGASINPVLAACLVRLIPSNLDGCAIDPTCGSGTLLFERLRYSEEQEGLGIDVSPTAEKAFYKNLNDNDQITANVDFRRGDARDNSMWQPCTSVVANLPFGIRIKEKPEVLARLYASILKNALANIHPNGKILLTSSFKRGLDIAISKNSNNIRVFGKYRCEMGGLFYQIVVLGKK